jgi:hypothetical protein
MESYDAICTQLMARYKPRDIMEQMLIRTVIDATWEAFRCCRHKALSIERRFRQRLEYQAKRSNLSAQQKAALAREEKPGNPPTLLDRLNQLDEVVGSTVNDIETILDQLPTEFDHARALQESIEYYERLDRGHNAALTRQTDAFEQFFQYRTLMSQHFGPASDNVIDADYSDVTTSPIVPADTGNP